MHKIARTTPSSSSSRKMRLSVAAIPQPNVSQATVRGVSGSRDFPIRIPRPNAHTNTRIRTIHIMSLAENHILISTAYG